jgi:hypothetical protein
VIHEGGDRRKSGKRPGGGKLGKALEEEALESEHSKRVSLMASAVSGRRCPLLREGHVRGLPGTHPGPAALHLSSLCKESRVATHRAGGILRKLRAFWVRVAEGHHLQGGCGSYCELRSSGEVKLPLQIRLPGRKLGAK